MRRILIIDDDEMSREILGDFLDSDYEVLHADDGTLAIEMIKVDNEKPDVVMLDLMMPELDGFGFLKEVKEENLLDKTPIIIISSLLDKEIAQKCREYGVMAFLPKPFSKETTLKVVNDVLNKQ